MASPAPVALILGSGPNVGLHVAKCLSAKGYKIATVSRTAKAHEGEPGQAKFEADLSRPSSIADVFAKVKATVGIPSLVIYNGDFQSPQPGLVAHPLTDIEAAKGTKNGASDPLSISVADFTSDLNVNTISVFAAAQESVKAFEQLPETASRTFIFTGNCLNTMIMLPIFTGGVGKSASSHLIQSAAAAYADRGFKFYYVDERKPDGAPAFMDIDGEAHGKYYTELSEHREQGPWQQTFVKGKGYTAFR